MRVTETNTEKGLFTYDYVSDNKIRIRLSNDKDPECDTFDSIEDIIRQMSAEGTEIENTKFQVEIKNNKLEYKF